MALNRRQSRLVRLFRGHANRTFAGNAGETQSITEAVSEHGMFIDSNGKEQAVYGQTKILIFEKSLSYLLMHLEVKRKFEKKKKQKTINVICVVFRIKAFFSEKKQNLKLNAAL